MTLHDLSDGELLSRLETLCIDSRRIDVRVIELLIEVEERRLDLKSACSSLYDFCLRRLGLSAGAAQRRMTVARMAKHFPCLLGHLESGKIHLSTLAVLRDAMTEANVEELVELGSTKSRRELEAHLRARAAATPGQMPTETGRPAPAVDTTLPLPALVPEVAAAPPSASALDLRYPLHVLMSAELDAKLTRARDLMRHANPRGDAAVILDRALDALIDKLERRRFGKTNRPQEVRRPCKRGHVPNAVRREISERDAEQCAFVDTQNRRCSARGFLEIDHRQSRALGGNEVSKNLRLLCRAHNKLHAEEDFGRDHIERKIHERQRTCVPTRDRAALATTTLATATLAIATAAIATADIATVDIATVGDAKRDIAALDSARPDGARRDTANVDTVAPRARPDTETLETVKRGLVSLGFRAKEASRALHAVAGRHSELPPIVDVLREALRVLSEGP